MADPRKGMHFCVPFLFLWRLCAHIHVRFFSPCAFWRHYCRQISMASLFISPALCQLSPLAVYLPPLSAWLSSSSARDKRTAKDSSFSPSIRWCVIFSAVTCGAVSVLAVYWDALRPFPPDCIRHVVVHSAGCHPASSLFGITLFRYSGIPFFIKNLPKICISQKYFVPLHPQSNTYYYAYQDY